MRFQQRKKKRKQDNDRNKLPCVSSSHIGNASYYHVWQRKELKTSAVKYILLIAFRRHQLHFKSNPMMQLSYIRYKIHHSLTKIISAIYWIILYAMTFNYHIDPKYSRTSIARTTHISNKFPWSQRCSSHRNATVIGKFKILSYMYLLV